MPYEALTLLPPVRDRIVAVMKAHPGLTARQVAEHIGLPRESVDVEIEALHAAGRITILRARSISRRKWSVA